MEVGELALELADEQVRAGDVARAARADAVLGERRGGGGDDLGVLAHSEVVVRAPVDDDAARAVGEPHERRARGRALEIDEVPVAAFVAQPVEALLECVQGGCECRVSGAHGAGWREWSHPRTIAIGRRPPERPRV